MVFLLLSFSEFVKRKLMRVKYKILHTSNPSLHYTLASLI